MTKVSKSSRVLSQSQMKRSLKSQRGMSFLGVLIILMMVVFLGMFAFKVGPAYIENQSVLSIAETASQRPELMRSKSKMREYLNKAFRTNNLWDLQPDEAITMVKDKKKGLILTVAYEKRANLIYNIDLVTRFNTPVGTGN